MSQQNSSRSYDDEMDPEPIGLETMFIGSVDSLRGIEINQRIPVAWNDQPPLLEGPRGQPETLNLLKGMVRQGIPPALRCAVWLSNVIQVVHPHREPNYWHEYRTLAKVRVLDHAYDTLMEKIVGMNYNSGAEGNNSQSTPNKKSLESEKSKQEELDAMWSVLEAPSYGRPTSGQEQEAMDNDGLERGLMNRATKNGRIAHKRVLCALNEVLGTDHIPQIPVLAALLLTAMSESYVFCAIREMIHAGPDAYYFAVGQRQERAVCATFQIVLNKLHPQTSEYLADRGVMDSPATLAPIFRDFFVGLLPIDYVLRIIDIYTLEGMKSIFRFAVAIFVLYKKHAAEQLITISNNKEWWSGLREWAASKDFSFELVSRKAYGVHGGGRPETVVGRGLRRQLHFPRRNILYRILRMEEERLEQQMYEDGHTDDDCISSSSIWEPPARPLGLIQPDPAEFELIKAVNFQSELEKPVLLQPIERRAHLAQWLPLTLRLNDLKLLYSTNYHGRSLDMFYNRVSIARHTLTICEVLAPQGQETSDNTTSAPIIVGMYASQAWRVSTEIYGDGGCFLFRLSPRPRSWKWKPRPLPLASSGTTAGSIAAATAASMTDWEAELEGGGNSTSSLRSWGSTKSTTASNETALLEQFMVSTRTYISMGGNPDGSCGLRLNEDLTRAETSTAVGFDNEPLHGGSGSVIDLGLVEVYGLVRQIDGRPV